MNPSCIPLLQLLADGEFHSGEVLGSRLGVSRAAVWKQLQQVQDGGLLLESVRGRGYRLAGGLSLLDAAAIRAQLSVAAAAQLDELSLLPVTESTNTYLLDCVARGERAHRHVCLAEMQSAGRGRRGRAWQSPFARNLYLSVVWRFEQGIAAVEGLSLAVGVALCHALEDMGVQGIGLKWPNDILYRSKKLGGVLLEIAGDVSGDCCVVVGLGLNVAMPEAAAAGIDQPWVDLRQIDEQAAANRNQLAAAILNRLLPLLAEYQQQRFSGYRDEWQRLNCHAGRPVVLASGKQEIHGLMRGVAENGALLLEIDGAVQAFAGGELSLRGAP